MNSDREAFSDPTVPSSRWRPLADPSSDSDRAVPHHNRRRMRKAAIIDCSILFIGILESKGGEKNYTLPENSWHLRVQEQFGIGFERCKTGRMMHLSSSWESMFIHLHALTTGFLSNGTEPQSIEMMSIQKQPAVVLVLKGALSIRLAPSLRKTLTSTGYCYWKSKIGNFKERICM